MFKRAITQGAEAIRLGVKVNMRICSIADAQLRAAENKKMLALFKRCTQRCRQAKAVEDTKHRADVAEACFEEIRHALNAIA
jgi:hypothetical protein